MWRYQNLWIQQCYLRIPDNSSFFTLTHIICFCRKARKLIRTWIRRKILWYQDEKTAAQDKNRSWKLFQVRDLCICPTQCQWCYVEKFCDDCKQWLIFTSGSIAFICALLAHAVRPLVRVTQENSIFLPRAWVSWRRRAPARLHTQADDTCPRRPTEARTIGMQEYFHHTPFLSYPLCPLGRRCRWLISVACRFAHPIAQKIIAVLRISLKIISAQTMWRFQHINYNNSKPLTLLA